MCSSSQANTCAHRFRTLAGDSTKWPSPQYRTSRARRLSRRYARLAPLVETARALDEARGDLGTARELAAEHGYDLGRSTAYSDSVTDLPLLELVGRPHAVNPDRALLRAAQGRQWPVLRFAPLPRRGRGAA